MRHLPIVWKPFLAGFFIAFAVCLIGIVSSLFTGQKLHGEARWARIGEVRKAKRLEDAGILLGRINGKFMRFGGTEHVLLEAPTRAGKGVGVVIPNLLQWPDSVVVLDVKQENWAATAGFRMTNLRQQTLLFNPLDAHGRTCRYNPLAYINRRDQVEVVNELQKISVMLFPLPLQGETFWAESARTAFLGVAAYVAATVDDGDDALPFTIGEIYRQFAAGDAQKRFPKIISQREREGKPLSGACVSALRDWIMASANTFTSTRQSVTAKINLWLNPYVDAATAVSDFDLREFRDKRISLYLGVSPDDLDRVAPIYGLLFQQLIDLPPPIAYVPQEWLSRLPGELLVATHITLEDRSRPMRSLHELSALFSSSAVIGSKVAGGAATVWSDHQIHRDNFGRILIHDDNLRSRQVGRLVQRLLEIETYRMLAMLPVPITRKIIPQLARADQRLAELTTNHVAMTSIEDEQRLLDELTRLAAETERLSAQTSHRFNASRAYYDIVKLRIAELREERIEGLQMLQEFMIQRLSSAMGTCELVHTKLETLSMRLGRASALLRTRVDLSMEAQIRDLLKSMDSRARVQLRMQETVEGLSVVVLSYYLLGIVGYGLKALKAADYDIDVELLTGIAIPFVLLGVFFVVRGMRQLIGKLHKDG